MVKVTWFQIPGAGFEVGSDEEEDFVREVEEGHRCYSGLKDCLTSGVMTATVMMVIKGGVMKLKRRQIHVLNRLRY